LSPARTANRFGVAAGGVPRLTFRVSTAGSMAPLPWTWFRPGMPWRTACTMSVRFSSGAFRSNSAFMIFASSGESTYLP
jgi:hypothetical protein